MRENAVKRLWREDKPALGGWLSIGNTFSAEVMAGQELDWLCIDMQHGVIGYDTAVPMLQTISATNVTPIVRVPWCEQAMIMKMLDAGAYGIIVPLVNSRAEAERAAAACRYPPKGIRNHGPTRAAYYAGFDYLAHANDEVLCIPQIETVEAMDNLDGILSVPGVVPGVHSNTLAAAKRIEEGFRLVRITGDHSAMASAVREDIRIVLEARG
jgi:4-hydroxy-2-oxoheptanedioate aldolase